MISISTKTSYLVVMKLWFSFSPFHNSFLFSFIVLIFPPLFSFILSFPFINFHYQGYVEKMFKMVMAISHKEGAKINANTFELCIEVTFDSNWLECNFFLTSFLFHLRFASISLFYDLLPSPFWTSSLHNPDNAN